MNDMNENQWLEIPLEIWQCIFDFCDFKTQLIILSLCSYLNCLRIDDLYNIDFNFKKLLTNEILQQKKYSYVTKLDASYIYRSNQITDVSKMKHLKILNAGYDCGIDQNGINGLSLTELNATDNKKIKDVSFMAPTLKILRAVGNCGIDQKGIANLSLVKLNANFNKNITDVSFMSSTLKILFAEGNCGIDQNGIKGLSLVELYISDNIKIIDVSFMMSTLKILYGQNSRIDYESFYQ